jgi:hypothetical protein
MMISYYFHTLQRKVGLYDGDLVQGRAETPDASADGITSCPDSR